MTDFEFECRCYCDAVVVGFVLEGFSELNDFLAWLSDGQVV